MMRNTLETLEGGALKEIREARERYMGDGESGIEYVAAKLAQKTARICFSLLRLLFGPMDTTILSSRLVFSFSFP